MHAKINQIFSKDGKLSQNIKGFAPREAQREMALQIATIVEKNEDLVCEAGTGTGKTFAYLVPILLSHKKVILSTGTKPLQEQLFFRDLPTVRKALGVVGTERV